MAQGTLSTFTPFEEDAALIRQARDDPAAFAPIYERYANRIYGYCLRQVNDPTEAEDLTSQIFIAVLHALHAYHGGSVQAWLFRIAHNTITSHFRNQTRRRKLMAAEMHSTMTSSYIPAAEHALANLIRDERGVRLRALIRNLPVEQRELLALRVDGDLSAKEIGQIIGKRENAVRVALFRLFQKLRADLQDEDSL